MPPLPARDLIQEATLSVETEKLGQNGIRTLRILNESRFVELLEKMVEARIQAKLKESLAPDAAEKTAVAAPTPQELSSAVREEYRASWVSFRSGYEERLRKLEERLLTACRARSPSPPGR